MSPNTCCSVFFAASAVNFAHVPNEWNLQTRIYSEDGCRGKVKSQHGNSCMGFTDIEGTRVRAARYGFVGGKPSAAAAVVEIDGEEPCKRPEQLVFVDGPTYDLVGLTEEEYTEM
ncbi:hypothetical protein MN608_03185 [Microdochium nivale]|nr:hypothetical protein MN608_03185 [Microdochium nivale]